MQLMSFFTLHGLTVDEARERIYLVDSQGLIFNERGPLAEHKKCWLLIFCCEQYLMAWSQSSLGVTTRAQK